MCKQNMMEYFRAAKNIDLEIRTLEERIAHLQARAESCTRIYSDMPRSDSPNPDQRYDIVAALIDVKAGLLDKLREYVDRYQSIYDIIARIPDARMRVLLELRYLNGNTWEQVAEKMNYTVRNIYNLHNAAIKAAEQVFDEAAKAGDGS